MISKQTFISKESQTIINILKCIACVGVVATHTCFKEIPIGSDNLMIESRGWTAFVDVVQLLICVCVPLFYAISGYLFFQNYHSLSTEWFGKKIKSRIKTLLVPYLVGNVVVFFCFYLSHILLRDRECQDTVLSLQRIIGIFWNPLGNPVFWFLRDLMIVIVCCPVFCWLIKKTNYQIITVLGGGWLMDFWPSGYDGFSSVSFFFFYLGAMFSMKKVDIIQRLNEYKRFSIPCAVLVLYVLCVVVAYVCPNGYALRLSILTGLVLVCWSAAKLYGKACLCRFDSVFWVPASFFVYAYHHVVQLSIKIGLFLLIRPSLPVWNFLIFFVTLTTTVILLVNIYGFISKRIPLLSRLLTGR